MAKDKTQLLRLIFIDQKIREGMESGMLANCRSIAREYEVSSKSILRDIDYLKHQRDAPIEYDPARRGYFYTETDYALPALSLTESDLFAICIAEQALRQYKGTPLYGRLKKIFSKIEEGLPQNISFPSSAPLPVTFLHRGQTTIDPVVWENISNSLKNNCSVRLHYKKPGDMETSERLVDPFLLIGYHGEWYLVGHCYLRKKTLTFALSRIKHAAQTERKAAHCAPENLQQEISSNFGIFSSEGRQRVTIRFGGKAADIIRERQWHPEQELHAINETEVTLSFDTGNLHEVKRWVLSWGADATVEKPAELITLLQQELTRLQLLYT